MGLGSWIGGLVFDGARELVARAQRFSRTRSKAQQKAELEQWNRNHIPLGFDVLGACAVCGKPRAIDVEHCPGPVKRWRMTRPETAKCEAMYQHNPMMLGWVPRCEICDPLGSRGRP